MSPRDAQAKQRGQSALHEKERLPLRESVQQEDDDDIQACISLLDDISHELDEPIESERDGAQDGGPEEEDFEEFEDEDFQGFAELEEEEPESIVEEPAGYQDVEGVPERPVDAWEAATSSSTPAVSIAENDEDAGALVPFTGQSVAPEQDLWLQDKADRFISDTQKFARQLEVKAVERMLGKTRLKVDNTDVSVLEILTTEHGEYGDGATRFRYVLDRLVAEIENTNDLTAMVWTYAVKKKIWTKSPSSRVSTARDFLGTLQDPQALANVVGNAETTVKYKLRFIKRITTQWGSQWFDKMQANELISADCPEAFALSKWMLMHLAPYAEAMNDLDKAVEDMSKLVELRQHDDAKNSVTKLPRNKVDVATAADFKFLLQGRNRFLDSKTAKAKEAEQAGSNVVGSATSDGEAAQSAAHTISQEKRQTRQSLAVNNTEEAHARSTDTQETTSEADPPLSSTPTTLSKSSAEAAIKTVNGRLEIISSTAKRLFGVERARPVVQATKNVRETFDDAMKQFLAARHIVLQKRPREDHGEQHLSESESQIGREARENIIAADEADGEPLRPVKRRNTRPGRTFRAMNHAVHSVALY